MSIVVGPLACAKCRRRVSWDRVGTSWRLVERVDGRIIAHACPA